MVDTRTAEPAVEVLAEPLRVPRQGPPSATAVPATTHHARAAQPRPVRVQLRRRVPAQRPLHVQVQQRLHVRARRPLHVPAAHLLTARPTPRPAAAVKHAPAPSMYVRSHPRVAALAAASRLQAAAPLAEAITTAAHPREAAPAATAAHLQEAAPAEAAVAAAPAAAIAAVAVAVAEEDNPRKTTFASHYLNRKDYLCTKIVLSLFL